MKAITAGIGTIAEGNVRLVHRPCMRMCASCRSSMMTAVCLLSLITHALAALICRPATSPASEGIHILSD